MEAITCKFNFFWLCILCLYITIKCYENRRFSVEINFRDRRSSCNLKFCTESHEN